MTSHRWPISSTRHPDRVRALIYLYGTGVEWSLHHARHQARARDRLMPGERQRLDRLAGASRDPAEEIDFLTLSWLPDYADHDTGRAEARALASQGHQVNYALNEALHREDTRCRIGEVDLRALTVPVLVVQGALDPRPLECCDSLVDALPVVRRVVLAGAGHNPWVGRPADLATTIQDWLPTLR